MSNLNRAHERVNQTRVGGLKARRPQKIAKGQRPYAYRVSPVERHPAWVVNELVKSRFHISHDPVTLAPIFREVYVHPTKGFRDRCDGSLKRHQFVMQLQAARGMSR